MIQLNPFQIYVLKRLNVLMPIPWRLATEKAAWLTSNLRETDQNLERLIDELVQIGFISAKTETTNGFATMDSIPVYAITQSGRDYLADLDLLATLAPTINTEADPDQVIVTTYLKYLNGAWNGKKIMKSEDYQRLYDYTVYVIKHNRLPSKVSKIKWTSIHTEFIRQTYYQLYKECKLKVQRKLWVSFLHSVFEQFRCAEDTTDKKFKNYGNNYEQDRDSIELPE